MKGQPPGALVYIGERYVERVKVRLINYNQDTFSEREVTQLADCLSYIENKEMITWIDIEGLSDLKTVEEIGKLFQINPLQLEDVLNTDHRPKLEELNDLVFLLLKAPHVGKKKRLDFEQFGLFLGDNFVLSFQELAGDIFSPVKSRIEKGKGRLRKSNADYLFYALIDSVVDSYIFVLEKMGAQAERYEQKNFDQMDENFPIEVNRLRTELLLIKKAIYPIREALKQICREGSGFVSDATIPFMRDAYEHSIQIQETAESYRDMMNGLIHAYATSVSQKTNETMKVLTMFASIFIPLTFIVGVYGMNFRHMPELEWRWGYWACWGLMAAIAGAILYYFRRKKWL